ncbi:Stk1 family PASTA domain-containing Ser/Thr kinase [Allobranchiibius sp. GilTou73]|uniref:Stk1 family PASTA domain-containing Ser/Thr kinase n=1 Tax=Allobranchiibius sp. GilTou73 TaxID=2904523 RepID=UPI001F483986|nr:Stk1 family PASTA domain-containing Ser/Thr kinase [Allobranchiibius sp. GilTou73]UIJ35523.1 Stk1 family PASTA domain-containing Ser/Thr kinase [Allobranchiibius sp. GilTou73]
MNDTPRILGGRYEVGELIGRGGMAEVHLGHDTRLGRTVAIKMLRSDLARDPSFLTRFRREAQSAAGLNHHAVVAVYDSGEDIAVETGGARVDVPYIVMEYVEGETLRDILDDEGKLAPDEAARITMGILSALDYSHEKGIVHRDIKPANVMLTRGGSVKVMDFGIARALADTAATMTSAQAVVGTARYLSPEQAQGETVDARSDLYSAGCVLFELLTGRTPFVGEPVSLVYQHITDQPQPPSVYEPSVPPAMDAVTLHSLEKPRGSRYQHAGDFRADLQRARTGEPLSAAAAAMEGAGRPMDGEPHAVPAPAVGHDPTAEYDGSHSPPRRTLIWVAAVVALLAAILGIGYLVMNSGDGTKLTSVPNVVNLTQAQAIATLKSSGFAPSVHKVTNDATIGQVVSQDPSSGDARAGSTVLIDVSSGPDALPIPDLSGQTVDQAKQALKDAGFTNVSVSSQQVPDTQYDQGVVVSTTPASGNSANPSSPLILNVSSGQVTVPSDLKGKSTTAAQTELRAAHLSADVQTVTTSDPNLVDKIVRVDDAGQKVAVNSIITIYKGTAPPTTATSTVTSTETITPPSSTTSTPPSSTSTSTSTSPSSPTTTSSSPSKSGSPPTQGLSTP